MKITNNTNLPKVIYDVLAKDFYDLEPKPNVYSVSEIINPIKLTLLRRRHRDEITEDVSELVYRTWGNLMHEWLQSFSEGEAFKEERLSVKIGDYVLSGKFDLYFDRTLWDYKMTSVWTYIYKSRMLDWEKSLNLYRYLANDANIPVDYLKIILMFRDWNKRKSLETTDYPNQIEVVDIPLWSIEDTQKWIDVRFTTMSSFETVADNEIPECSPEERWQDKNKYAVMKGEGKRAVKLFEEEYDAQEMAHNKGENYHVELRKGTPKRCLEYCEVAEFCDFGKKAKEEQ